MRKAMIIFALLLVLTIGGISYAHASLTASQYDVSFTEVASYGDVSAVDGLTVSVQTQLAQHLLWDSVYTFGQEPNTQTTFDFSSKPRNWQGEYIANALSLDILSDFSISAYGGDLLSDSERDSIFRNEWDSALSQDITSMSAFFYDVASRTKNGEQHSETINIRDYYEYYSINVNFFEYQMSPNYFIRYDGEGRQYISKQVDYIETREVFSNYFKIPVPENHRVTVDIHKDSAGNVVQISLTQESPVWLRAVSVDTKPGIYFALETEGLTDLRDINGNFGIYLLPASTILDYDGAELPTLDYHNLSAVYPLDESVHVQRLDLSEDESCLNLLTIEDDILFLTVIELATMTERQKLPLFDNIGEQRWQNVIYKGGLFFLLLDDARFVLAQMSGDSIYQIVLSDARDYELLNEDVFASGYYRHYDPVVSWDGARLAIVTAAQPFFTHIDNGYTFGHIYDICGFEVEIFDEDGLKHKGIYKNSLDVMATMTDYYGRCRLIDSGGLSPSW